MFEKKEDKIFDFAFGELSDHEAQIFEAELMKDAPSAAEVEFLRSMKSDLASLRDIPEMQFSKERLRSAILEQGLKPKRPVSSWINWILAPSAAACTLALGYVLLNGTTAKTVTYVPAGNRVATNDFGPKPTISVQPNITKETPVTTDSSTVDDSVPASGNSNRYVGLHSRHSSPTSREDMRKVNEAAISGLTMVSSVTSNSIQPSDTNRNTTFASKAGGGFAGGGNSESSPQFGNADVKTMNVRSDALALSNDAMKVAFDKNTKRADADVKMIEINRDEDSGVGAASATEISNNSNVVIGG